MSFFYFKQIFRKYIKYIVGIFLVGILLIFLLFNNSKEDIVIDNEELIKVDVNEEVENNDPLISVDIKGSVNNPGVYSLEKGSRVIDLINLSGGLTSNADTGFINLSKELEDQMVVIIYSKEEIDTINGENTIVKYIEKECICPSIKNDACIDDNKITNNEPQSEEKKDTEHPISINTSDISTLMMLPGIGETKARAIVEYREKVGSFKTIEELMNVSGIGNSTFEKIKDLITT